MDTNGVIATLNDLIETSRDGEQGFRTCAQGVNSANLKALFGKEESDKLPPQGTDQVHAIPSLSAVQEDVLSALVNLGYQRAAAEKAVSSVENNGAFDAIFRATLAVMAK